MNNIIIHQIPVEPFQVLTYIVACPQNRDAVIIDPAGDEDKLLAFVAAADADRFLSLGASSERTRVTGNIKFDIELPDSLNDDGRALREALFPDRPVWLRRIDGHAGWANSAALARADRDLGGDWQEPGGHVHRDEQGQPTGILVDKSMAHIDRAVPATPDDLIDAALQAAADHAAARALDGWIDAARALLEELL